jgi:uncharacterized protein YfaS (alpha-2-macroglobulin family)
VKKSTFLNFSGLTLAMLMLAVAAYSIFIAVHQADPQETVVLGQTQLAAGSPAGFRVLVRNRVSGQPVKGAKLHVSLISKTSGAISLGSFVADRTGTFDGSLNVPDVAPGDYEIIVDTSSRLGRDHIVRKIQVLRPARLFLSCDKPIYQPGQTIHMRSLMLNARTGKPFTNEPVTFEVSDSNGNKVFKESLKSSAFGIASTDFVLATELNLGRYRLAAVAGPTTVERTVEVKQYVLPKFKVHVVTDQAYYLPGQAVSGTVEAHYFFGKPVGNATIKLAASTLEEKPVCVAMLSGQTDAVGKFPFHFVLPDFFVGLPQKNAHAVLDLTAEVQDAAAHSEKTTASLTVAQNDLEIAAIPETGSLVSGVENIIYVLASYPDGRPTSCKVFLKGVSYTTDAQGACEIKMTPSEATQSLDLTALDQAGHKAKLTFQADKTQIAPNLLIRADKSVYQAGETANLTILSPEDDTTLFVDAIKDGQTVLTKSTSLHNHRAQCSFALPSSLTGALVVNAYVITARGEDQGSSRVLYINPAGGLRIATKLSKPVYRPGELASVDFDVTDSQGHPAAAALGIAAVDESVFALQENRPGLLRQFLDAEGDMLRPRYQINFFDNPSQILLGTQTNQKLASAYLASLQGRPVGGGAYSFLREDSNAQSLINELQKFQGTAEYDSLRKNPQFTDAFQFLEDNQGSYNLREATGPAKQRAVEAHRHAYFDTLGKWLTNAFIALVFLTPIVLLAIRSFQTPKFESPQSHTPSVCAAVWATRLYNKFGALTIFPLAWYPAGFALLHDSPSAGWFLLAVETVTVLALVGLGGRDIRYANREPAAWSTHLAGVCLTTFFAQFAFSRAAFILIALREVDGNYGILLCLGSIVAPLIIWAVYGFGLKIQLAQRGITVATPKLSLVLWTATVLMVLVLSSMMMPALARAKQKAQRISLINTLKQIDTEKRIFEADNPSPEPAPEKPPRVRRDFPETLLWRPELITDDHGHATLEVPLADSITTWRTSIDGVSAAGKIGSAEVPIPVFQDFFVDLDLPVSMSLGDEISVPIACYNYLNEPQDIRLTLAGSDWFESSSREATVHLAPNEVKSARMSIKVARVGDRSLRVTARGTKMSDAVEREIRVLPVGEKIEHTRNDVLHGDFTDVVSIPTKSIPDSEKLVAKFYPSRFSEIVEGLDSIFEAPHGCFEQTSSTTYPNVLALDYLKRVGRLTPEVEIKARQFINTGYQRLLTFEVRGGGFEWFGHSPAHVGLTAYGVLEFMDMSRIQNIDQDMFDRTVKWLLAQQNADGSWNQADGMDDWAQRKPLTAYVAWSLAEAGDRSANLDKALDYLRNHPDEISTPYGKALAANAFLTHDRKDSFGQQLAIQLHDSAFTGETNTVHWTSLGSSLTFSRGVGLEVETTALTTLALIKAGLWPQTVKQALNWISRAKEPNGTWGSTQATILAMRALLAGSSAPLGQDFQSVVTVEINHQTVETFRLNSDNSDVMKQINLTKYLRMGENQIHFHQTPEGELPFQLAGTYWNPSLGHRPAIAVGREPLQITMQYDHSILAVNATLNCAVAVTNNTRQRIKMAIVDLGIPAGFEVDDAAFAAMVDRNEIAKFETTGSQIILYLSEISESAPFRFSYTLRAKYPLRVQTPPSAVYEYYQSKNRAETKPVTLIAQ